jgi:hypothetical protein
LLPTPVGRAEDLAGPVRPADGASRRRRRSLSVGGGCQAAEQAERFGGSCAWVGGVGEDRQSGVEDELEALVVELEVADLVVAEVLDAADVEADVALCPVLAELVAAGRQLADEVGEVAVIRVAPGGGAQRGYAQPSWRALGLAGRLDVPISTWLFLWGATIVLVYSATSLAAPSRSPVCYLRLSHGMT